MVTSDKAYRNLEWVWGYKETDLLGGDDIYSGSKGAAELIIHSYIKSFFSNNNKIRIGEGRAGNVIGGGDWAEGRIIVDCFNAWNSNQPVLLRSSKSTRPWQHVLEPLSGYLQLASSLNNGKLDNGEALITFNSDKTVQRLFNAKNIL